MQADILVVDDESEIADLVDVYLRSEGFAVRKAATVAQALQLVAQQEPDLALLDVMLPDGDGFSLCSRLRENYFFPILMLTARVEDTDKITGLTLGADDYITKPFHPLELVARVKTQLRRFFPILMLTARVEDTDKITGLTLGADDYITKPFHPLELVARVKTQLRRYRQYNTGPRPEQPEQYDIRGLHHRPNPGPTDPVYSHPARAVRKP